MKSDAGEPNRGAKTRLTRREINNKLAQVPVFYLEKEDRVFVDNNMGFFFVEKVLLITQRKQYNLSRRRMR